MLFYIVLLRIKYFLYPVAYTLQPGDGPLNEIFFTGFSSPMSQSIIAVLLIYIQSLMINRIGIKHKINTDIGLLPGAMYALFISLIPIEAALYPVLIANTFIVIALQNIFTTYNKKQVAKAVFSSGMAASIASLFYFPYLYFFFITTISLLILRSFTIKERLQHLLGWITPYVLMYVWQFWFDAQKMIIPHYFDEQYALFKVPYLSSIHEISFSVAAVLMILYFLFQYSKFSSKKEITVQKKIDIFYWVLLYGGLSTLFYNHVDITQFLTIGFPIGYMIAMAFIGIKNKIVPEILHLVLLGLWVFINFY